LCSSPEHINYASGLTHLTTDVNTKLHQFQKLTGAIKTPLLKKVRKTILKFYKTMAITVLPLWVRNMSSLPVKQMKRVETAKIKLLRPSGSYTLLHGKCNDEICQELNVTNIIDITDGGTFF
jgi:hypothetical protein